jgi:hypothetical protein
MAYMVEYGKRKLDKIICSGYDEARAVIKDMVDLKLCRKAKITENV